MIKSAPKTWGKDKTNYRHDAVFILGGISAKDVMSQLPSPKKDIEIVTAGDGDGVIFRSTLKSHVTKSTLMKLPSQPIYQQLTLRNSNTCYKLLKMLDDEE